LSVQYDFWAGETDLARLVPSPIDDEVRLLVHQFVALDDEAQSLVRTSLTIDDLYTLLHFCRRATVASLRDGDAGLARDALAAIALVDVDRVDWRDVPGPLELTSYAVGATGGDLADQLRRLNSMSVEKMGPMVGRLQNQSVAPSLRSAGYIGVTTRHGFGLLDCRSGVRKSDNLGPLLVGLADEIDFDDYRTSSLTLGGDLPPVWFPRPNRDRAEAIADASSGAGSVWARHRPGPDADAQQFTVFVLGTGAPERADELLQLSEGDPGVSHAALAMSHGSIFVLLIARSWKEGTDGTETAESLERFREPFLAALRASS